MEENGMYNMEKQHKLGKLHALERICMLLDEDSFREIGSNITNLEDAFNIKKGQFPYDGVITGYGTIGGQKVVIYFCDVISNHCKYMNRSGSHEPIIADRVA